MDKPSDFYFKLNKSTAEYRDNWSIYRKRITDYIMSSFNTGKKTLVLGAGNMNDIEINVLREVSSGLVLADIDIESVQTGDFSDVKKEFIDFGCLGDISNAKSYEDAIWLIKTINPQVNSSLGKSSFENILISPFYTQLVIPWLFAVYPDMRTDPKGLEAGLELASKTIKISNEYIRSLAAERCKISLWTDMLEFSNDDPIFIDICKNIDDTEWVDAFMQHYIENHGHGLGSYGHWEMEQYIHNLEYKWFIWPFNSSISMIVKITSGMISE